MKQLDKKIEGQRQASTIANWAFSGCLILTLAVDTIQKSYEDMLIKSAAFLPVTVLKDIPVRSNLALLASWLGAALTEHNNVSSQYLYSGTNW